MAGPHFFPAPAPLRLDDICAATGARLPDGDHAGLTFAAVAPLDRAGPHDISFLENPKYIDALRASRAGACLVAPRYADKVPPTTLALVVAEPYVAFARVLALLYPQAMRPATLLPQEGRAASFIHAEARLEDGVVLDPCVVIGAGAEIGAGTHIGAHAVIGAGVRIGRDCSIGAHTTLSHALVGNNVIIHPGTRIGQDGFGFAMGPGGHLKVPQVGRVIIQDHVEIGANSTIDRGAIRDTVIGEGAKIDNLVQIAHNVVIGRHAVIVAQSGISGSTEIGDFAALGGQAGITGHLRIGAGAQIAAQSGVMTDVPARERWGGSPARPMREWFRTLLGIEQLLKQKADESKGKEPE
ncbi:MAG: UDP-3-O-(3-hydroxymyristoyl)glucosamine N-acyltransferase [Hyphomicrobiales bacterium]|nr:UDP-3-O-(3-hydroxymyristoyl)glucosamine N-acyltransferase [Hyphomicrobiales bacterium]